jgi:hypothetical protein
MSKPKPNSKPSKRSVVSSANLRMQFTQQWCNGHVSDAISLSSGSSSSSSDGSTLEEEKTSTQTSSQAVLSQEVGSSTQTDASSSKIGSQPEEVQLNASIVNISSNDRSRSSSSARSSCSDSSHGYEFYKKSTQGSSIIEPLYFV